MNELIVFILFLVVGMCFILQCIWNLYQQKINRLQGKINVAFGKSLLRRK